MLSAEVHYLSDRMGRRLLFSSDIFLFSLSSGVTVLETRACFLLREDIFFLVKRLYDWDVHAIRMLKSRRSIVFVCIKQ